MTNNYSIEHSMHGSEAHPASYYMGIGGSFPRGKQQEHEVDQ